MCPNLAHGLCDFFVAGCSQNSKPKVTYYGIFEKHLWIIFTNFTLEIEI